jgi:hypothetical protein
LPTQWVNPCAVLSRAVTKLSTEVPCVSSGTCKISILSANPEVMGD